jgi:hypothetical protein
MNNKKNSDESWIYGYDPETKQQSFQCKNPNSPRPKKTRQAKSKVNGMPIIFFDIKEIVHKEFVLAGQSVNSAYYYDILRQMRENVRRHRPELWPQNNWLLRHNNQKQHDPTRLT